MKSLKNVDFRRFEDQEEKIVIVSIACLLDFVIFNCFFLSLEC